MFILTRQMAALTFLSGRISIIIFRVAPVSMFAQTGPFAQNVDILFCRHNDD